MPTEIAIVAPERQNRELVKVIRILRGDGNFRHPDDPEGRIIYPVHHYFDQYMDVGGAWNWSAPGDIGHYQAEWDYWPFVFFFSDGTFGMSTMHHLQDALRALDAELVD
jgi:hypothetical protein